MQRQFSFHSDPSLELQVKIKQAIGLILIGGFLYPAWAFVHFMVYQDSVDSYWERIGVYASFLGLIAIVKLAKNMSLETKLNVLRLNRWILVSHYFTVVARNEIAVQYAIAAYFLVFILASLFESPKYFLFFAAYVMLLSLGCTSNDPNFPAYSFQLGLANCLLISFYGTANRFKLMEQLKQRETTFRTMFETAGVGMVALDFEGKIAAANAAFAEMIGYSREHLITKKLDSFSSEKNSTQISASIEQAIKEKKQGFKIEIEMLNQRRQKVWGNVSLSVIKPGPASSFVLAMIENITEQKAAEKTIVEQQEKITHSSRMTALGEMAGGIAHEINTPLGIIGMAATVIKDRLSKSELDIETMDNAVDRIQNTIHRIAKIIQGLRKFSRDGSQEPMQSVALKSIIDETMDLCAQTLKAGEVEVTLPEIPEDLLVQARPVEISQVLLNLINNAYDATKAHSGPRWIKMDVLQTSEFVKVAISNSGPVIAPEIRKKIFQPFFTTKPIGQGTGLGLSISMGIMRSHHGTLTLDQDSPHTRFIMKICKGTVSGEQRTAA